MTQPQETQHNTLHELGYKIFLDRYAQKDMTRTTLAVGDTVIVVVNSTTGQREIGKITALDLPKVTIELNDGEVVTRDLEHVDKPLETDPGQMMDRVAAGIARVEATPEKQREWTEKFRWLLDDWKFVPGGRILTAAGTDQKLSYYNCMPPEQEILTLDGYKPIADVQVGDLVVTHKNRLRPVLHRFERETEEPLYIIKPKKVAYDALRVTGDHKILVIRSEWVNTHRSRDGLRLRHTPEWIPAREIHEGDYLAVAYDGEECPVEAIYIPEYVPGYQVENGQMFKPMQFGKRGFTNHGTHYAINTTLTLDEDLCYLFGRWLGDGCVTHRSGTDIPSGIKIVFGLDEQEQAEEIARIVEAKFGIPAALKLSSTKRWYDLWVNSRPVGQFFKAFLGCYHHSKRLPSVLMHLPKSLTYELLRGLFSADSYTSDNYIGILLANRALTIQVHQLLLRLGYFFSIFENTHRNGRTPSYRVSATVSEAGDLFEQFFAVKPNQRKYGSQTYLDYDGLKWVRIEEIAVENYSGMVLDIEVEEDHSFVSAGVVVSNCYVLKLPHDSRGGILKTLGQMTEIMSRGGGVGITLSSLRPRHSYVKGVNGRSSGSVSWGALYSFVTGLIEQGGSRRGALMLLLSDWHPDIFDFISSKRKAGQITNANISVAVSDDLMKAVREDGDWNLMFPDTSDPDYDLLWDGDIHSWMAAGRKVIVHRTVKARELWNTIIESAWASAEPGLLFIDRYNKMANSWYFAPIVGVNPCGEQGLPGDGVCNLGALNLAKFYDDSTQDVAWDDLEHAVEYATRFLDNVIDVNPYFREENAEQQLSERRVGLGTMGLAELMIKCRVRYGSDESVEFINKLYGRITTVAYRTSSYLAAEKGAFPKFDAEKFLESGFMQTMPDEVRALVAENGIRNVTLLTQAPTGTTGTLVNTSTGIEPFFSWVYYRKSRLGLHEEKMPIVQQWFEQHPDAAELPDYFVTAMELSPIEHVKVQGAIQRWVDSSISKTSNLPRNYTVEQVSELYQYMYVLGCKGGTVYRDGSRDEQILMLKGDERAESEMAAVKGKKTETAKPASADEKIEQVATPHRVYPRPPVLDGSTVSFKTPFGTAYITMNSDDQDNPFEVFITVGKAGSDVQADAEAMGRMISLQLRTTAPHNRREMLKLIIDQLQNIGGARPVGFGPQRVLSLPDAVARALQMHYFNQDTPHQLGLPMNGGNGVPATKPENLAVKSVEAEPPIEIRPDGTIAGADMCPECGTVSLVRAEGCRRCLTCDYTEC